jgi:hypothetical protein
MIGPSLPEAIGPRKPGSFEFPSISRQAAFDEQTTGGGYSYP